jgi:hypothetical protein
VQGPKFNPQYCKKKIKKKRVQEKEVKENKERKGEKERREGKAFLIMTIL